MNSQSSENRLFEIVSTQGGYFTAWQAKKAGFIESNHPYHVQKGNWVREWLAFAGIESPKIRLIFLEQQFSEKLHAFTLPRERANSRVKDIVDILALIHTGQLDIEKLKVALKETFKRRKTHGSLPFLPEEVYKEMLKRLKRL